MRNLIKLILTLLLLSSVYSDIKLGSWNVRNLSNTGRQDAELGVIALYVQLFDIIALQEILDWDVTLRLEEVLKNKDCFRLPYSQKTVINRYDGMKDEGCSVFYNTEKLVYIGSYPLISSSFFRWPIAFKFKEKISGKEFIIISVHLIYGDSISKRVEEFEALQEVIIAYGLTNVILLGDFNLDITKSMAKKAFPVYDKVSVAINSEKTTIYDVSAYDNILCFGSFFNLKDAVVYKFDDYFFKSKLLRSVASRVVSDHRPIGATISLGE